MLSGRFARYKGLKHFANFFHVQLVGQVHTCHALCVQDNDALRMLLGLTRYCSALGMFAEEEDGFSAILSLMRRVRNTTNSLLRIVAVKKRRAILYQWVGVHAYCIQVYIFALKIYIQDIRMRSVLL